jgi:hypothetical protein
VVPQNSVLDVLVEKEGMALGTNEKLLLILDSGDTDIADAAVAAIDALFALLKSKTSDAAIETVLLR